MTDTIPSANAQSLGALQTTYHPVARSVKATKTVGLIILILGAAAIVGGVVLVFTRSDPGMLCLSAVGLAGVAFGIWAQRRSQAQASLRVDLHEQGLALTSPAGQELFRWDELAEVWQEILSRQYGRGGSYQTSHTYRLVAQDGRKAVLDDRIQGIAELGQAVQKAASPLLLDKALTRYGQGETLAFGKLALNREGLALGRRTLAWGDLASAEVRGGSIYIAETGRTASWAEILVREVPNVFVLLALVQAQKKAAS